MKRSFKSLLGLAIMLSALPAFSATLELNGIDFPEGKTVDLTLSPQPGAPDAQMKAKVTFRNGQAGIVVDYQTMKPAILFGGDVTCYVLWAVTRDGQVSNLGELLTPTAKGTGQFTTRNKNFALMVTAEPFYLVRKPSAIPTFISDPVETKKLNSTPFAFTAFRDFTPERAMKDIRGIAWDSKIPLELLQARKAHELAERFEADKYAHTFHQEATEALDLANQQFEKSPNSRELRDYSRRSVALSFEAMNIAVHRIEGIKLEKEIDMRRKEMEQLVEMTLAAKAEAMQAETRTKQAQQTTANLAKRTAVISNQKQQLQRETQELGDLLEGALSHVADTQNTARGYVVNLSDILFKLNEASLKPATGQVLAKLAGILLVMPEFQVTVEGYTDSTGKPEYNMKLSKERAESVVAFLTEEGISPQRLAAVGFGMEKPVADNQSEEGRRKNRRVEIVISEIIK